MGGACCSAGSEPPRSATTRVAERCETSCCPRLRHRHGRQRLEIGGRCTSRRVGGREHGARGTGLVTTSPRGGEGGRREGGRWESGRGTDEGALALLDPPRLVWWLAPARPNKPMCRGRLTLSLRSAVGLSHRTRNASLRVAPAVALLHACASRAWAPCRPSGLPPDGT